MTLVNDDNDFVSHLALEITCHSRSYEAVEGVGARGGPKRSWKTVAAF